MKIAGKPLFTGRVFLIHCVKICPDLSDRAGGLVKKQFHPSGRRKQKSNMDYRQVDFAGRLESFHAAIDGVPVIVNDKAQ